MIISKDDFINKVGSLISRPYKNLYYGHIPKWDRSIYLNSSNTFYGFNGLNEINGDFIANFCENFREFGKVHRVNGNVYLSGCVNLKTLNNLSVVKGVVCLYGCNSLEDVSSLKEVGSVVYIDSDRDDLMIQLLKNIKWKEKIRLI